jgi:hypothetical protein
VKIEELTERELDQKFEKFLKSKDLEKLMKKIVADCFVDFNKLLWNNRNFLKNQIK